jgi:hypothetical protein
MINLIAYSLLSISFAILIFFILKQRIDNKKIIAIAMQLHYDKERALEELNKLTEQKNLEQSDGFVKFISQSRDWAFEYIEEVQSALSKFDVEISSIIKWNETYGTVTDGGVYSDKIKQISLAYNQLKDLLPKDTETPND